MSLLLEFLIGAPPGSAETLEALSCAESLTDSVAFAIYEQVPIPELSSEDFILAFKYSGLTEPRNSEWSIIPQLREELVVSSYLAQDRKMIIHKFLLSLGRGEGNREMAVSEVPSYLFTKAGLAYHLAGSGNIKEALEHYSEVSKGALTGVQWLGAKLAEEQERVGIIPEYCIETMFLRALVLWSEGNIREAFPLFQKVAYMDIEQREVAISLHILGNINNWRQRSFAEKELRRSIEIGRIINNQLHVAQTLHSLANLLIERDRFGEAEEAFKHSIDIFSQIGDQLGVDLTLRSLAKLRRVRQNRYRFDEADEA